MTVCPCCGFKFEGDLNDGCASCGARAVGPPLSKPVSELPSFGRSLFVGVVGGLLLITFLVGTIIALFETKPVSLRFWSLMGAAETAFGVVEPRLVRRGRPGWPVEPRWWSSVPV